MINPDRCTIATEDMLVKGPVDLGCQNLLGADPRCTRCLNDQNQMNALVRLDNPYMWTHRILPGVAVGLAAGFLLGRFI